MPASIPDSVKPLLDDYIVRIQRDLPDLMTGCYLHGSIALDAFNPGLSDIDFITVIRRRCTPDDLARLAQIHQAMAQTYLQLPMQGSYFQASDLGKFSRDIEPAPYFSDGVLHPAGHHDVNAVTWWLLKNRGITLYGTPTAELNFEVDWDKLVSDMRRNLNIYWLSYVRQPARIAWLYSDYGVQWAVSGTLRQYYTFQEQSITSKNGACEYALTHLPAQWQRIVQEAINIRQGKTPSLYTFRLLRAIDTWRFLRFIIQRSNASFPSSVPVAKSARH